MLRILHIAPFNTAGVPMEFVRAERALGHHSRLITLGRHPYDYQEDICLGLPFLAGRSLSRLKRWLPGRNDVDNLRTVPQEIPLRWQPKSGAESALIALRDRLWERKIQRLRTSLEIENFDIYQLDGGLGLVRSGKIMKELKALGKRIVCCYLGSDLRIRGVIPAIDELSDLNLTVEFDHLQLHPHIRHIFFPFDPSRHQIRTEENVRLRIGHTTNNWKAKGSRHIVSVIHELEREREVQLVLIQNLPHSRAIDLKSTCDIMVDQLGELGYGINSLESLAMGIPTCTALPTDYESYLGDHPFITVNEENLKRKLMELMEDGEYRRRKGGEGRRWVEEHHDSRRVVRKILKWYEELGWT